MRYRFGEISYQSPSRFLGEIPDELLRVHGTYRSASRAGSWRSERGAGARAGSHRSVDDDAHLYSDEAPDYENGEGQGEKLRIGALVEHSVFGKGTIVTLAGEGESLKAVIDFSVVGRKSLLIKYAKLRIY